MKLTELTDNIMLSIQIELFIYFKTYNWFKCILLFVAFRPEWIGRDLFTFIYN